MVAFVGASLGADLAMARGDWFGAALLGLFAVGAFVVGWGKA